MSFDGEQFTIAEIEGTQVMQRQAGMASGRRRYGRAGSLPRCRVTSAASWAREEMSSLAKTWAMWVWTVRCET